MALFGKLVSVPVVDVDTENIKEVWPSMCLAIKSATFIGIDTELSGLGDRKQLNAKSVEDRYKSMSEVAKSRSILSLGVSCFKIKLNPDKTSKSKWYYYVQTFNVMVLCGENYLVEPASLKFLVDHSFDFNRQYATGVSYYRGNDKDNSSLNAPSVRGIFSLIVHCQVPLVLHNALVDLVFLYQNFYADLPNNLITFVADLSEMFPSGLIDTKYITDYLERMEASYLEYVFMQCQRENLNHLHERKQEVCFEFPQYPKDYKAVGYHPCGYTPRVWSKSELEKIRTSICLGYAAHGWCGRPRTCPLIHDVDLIISTDYLLSAKQRRSRKRSRKRKQKDNSSDKSDDGNKDETESLINSDNENDTSADVSCDKGDNSNISADKRTKIDEQVENGGVSNDSEDVQSQNSSKTTNDIVTNMTSSNDTSSNNHVQVTTNGNDSDRNILKTENLTSVRSGGHRAGFDAFMTCAILSVFIAKSAKNIQSDTEMLSLSDFNVDQFINKIYIVGKDLPLAISKSSFSKVSNNHKVKLEKLKFAGL